MSDLVYVASSINDSETITSKRITDIEELCGKYNIKEMWADFEGLPAERNIKGHVYFVTETFAEGKGIEGLVERIFAPDIFSDDEEAVRSTDFLSVVVAPDNPHPNRRNIDAIKARCHLLYDKERGVIIGQ